MPNETAIVLLVPEVGASIDAIRATHDPSAAQGVPAHVTLLYPWVPAPAQALDLERLRTVIAAFEAYDMTFRALGAFERTLYLAPADIGETTRLATAIFDAFPDYPPYRGAVGEFVPHLTIADGIADLGVVRRESDPAVAATLPIESTVRSVAVLASDAKGMWRVAYTLPLGVTS